MEVEKNNLNSIGISVADHVTAMLAYWDKDLICRFANAAYRDWFGKTKEEMINKITIKELLGPLYEKNLPYITKALQGEVQKFEREIPTPTGIKYSYASYIPKIENGEVKGFFVHVADISEIKLLEIELAKSAETIQLQNKLLLNFSNVVSHNLKSYANNLETMLDLYTTANTEETKETVLSYIKELSQGFSSSIKNLNEVTKVQNQNDLPYQLINIHDYIEKVVKILGIQINTTHATIYNTVSSDIGINTNIVYIESILLNLLTNALKYKHPERNPVIEINSYVEGNYLVLSVKDNGLGIDLKKYGKKLFNIYNTFHGNSDAQGIGMYITRFQVESMGGRIEVDSEVNVGSTFKVYFKL